DPHGLSSFFDKLRRQEGNSPRFLAILSDHPATSDRIEHVNGYIREKGLRGSTTNAPQFATIKQRLAAHVPASPPPTQATPGGVPPNTGPPSAPPSGAPPSGTPRAS